MESEATAKEEDGIESQIERSMCSRLQDFMEKADSLTFEGVRRVIEKDLGFEKYALDVHKRFIKQLLEKYLNSANDGNESKTLEVSKEERASLIKMEEEEGTDKHPTVNHAKEQVSGDEEKAEDFPVMGLLTRKTESKLEETQSIKKKDALSEEIIMKALRKRSLYFLSNSEKITMSGVRRLLEKDLELDESTLDPYKRFISKQLDEIINSAEISEDASGVEGKNKSSQNRTSESGNSKRSDSSDADCDEIDEVEPEDKAASKGKSKKIGNLKKRKRSEKETNVCSKKPIKHADMTLEGNSDMEDFGNVSNDNQSQSSSEKPLKKKKEVSTPAYGKRVEHLKSIIKSCGMGVPPSMYKKAKQVPDDKREAFMIKELVSILSREGLSAKPTEKEIKEVRKKKQREKELEGIDMSNIVSSTRRRSKTSFVVPPKPKSPAKKDESDIDSGNENGEEDDVDEEEGNKNSSSEEFSEDADDSD